MKMRAMLKLCEVAEALEEVGLVHEADEVHRVMARVAQVQYQQGVQAGQSPQMQAITAEELQIATQIGDLNAQKSSLQPTPQMDQDPASFATQIANNSNQIKAIDDQLRTLYKRQGDLAQYRATLMRQQQTPVPQQPVVR